MNTAQRILKNSGFLYGRMLITLFISLYSTRLILAALGQSDFGLFNVVGGTIAMLTFLNATMASASQRFMSYAQGGDNRRVQTEIFSISVILHFIVGILIVILLEIASPFIFRYLLNIELERVEIAKLIYQVMVVSTFFTIISVPYDAVLNSHENMFIIAVIGVVQVLLKFIIAIIITYTLHDKLLFFGFLMAISTTIILIIKRIYCHYKYPEVVTNVFKHYSKNQFQEMASFAGWSILGSISSMLTNYGKNIIINIYFGTKVNSAQAVTSQIVGQLGAFSTVLIKALNPVIVKTEGAGNRKKMFQSTFSGAKLSFFLLFLVSSPIIIEMPFVLKLWLKEVPQYTSEFCRFTLFTQTFGQMTLPLVTAIGAIGNIRKFQINISIAGLIPLSISIILFSMGASPIYLYITFFIYELVKGIIIPYHAKLSGGLSLNSYYKQVMLKCLFTATIVYFFSVIPLFFMEESLIRLFTVVAISTVTFLLIVQQVGLNDNERYQLKILINKLNLLRNGKNLKRNTKTI